MLFGRLTPNLSGRSFGPVGTPPVNTVAPVASGTLDVGDLLSVTNGTWTGDAIIVFTYQWRRDAANISGATSSTYTTVSADAETAVDCVVTGTNGAGASSQDSNDLTINAMPSMPASLLFDLEVTDLASYSGSGQVWADKDLDTAFDMNRGNTSSPSTDDPTFNGSAGTSGANWSLDGGDHFSLVGSNPALLASLHKTSGAGSGPSWIAFAGQLQAGFQALWGTSAGLAGIEVLMINSTLIRINVNRAGVTSNDFIIPEVSNGDDICAILTLDPTNTDDGKLYWNSTTPITDTDMSAATSSTDAGGDMNVGGARDLGSFPMIAGGLIYNFSGGNEFISDAIAGDIFSVIGARKGIDYLA